MPSKKKTATKICKSNLIYLPMDATNKSGVIPPDHFKHFSGNVLLMSDDKGSNMISIVH